MNKPPTGFSVYNEVSVNEALRAVTASCAVGDDGRACPLPGHVGDIAVLWPLDLVRHLIRTWPGTIAWSRSAGLAFITDFGPDDIPGDGHIQTRIQTCDPATLAPKPPSCGYSRSQRRPFTVHSNPPADLAQGA